MCFRFGFRYVFSLLLVSTALVLVFSLSFFPLVLVLVKVLVN